MIARAKDALEDAAGPTPWWTATLPQDVRANLKWTKDDGTSSLSRDGAPVLSLGFYCYTLALDSHLLIWRTTRTPLAQSSVHMEIYDFDQLVAPLGQRPQQVHGSIRAQTTPRAILELNPPYEDSCECVFPQELRKLDELLFFSSAGASTTLWHLQPARGRVAVYPQDWFNTGDWDYGYQWPTRVKREAETGVVFGQGIRIGYFALSPTMRSLDWRELP